MAKDELSLGVEMGRLEIEPKKEITSIKQENPFVNLTQNNHGKKYFPLKSCSNSKCLCSQKKSITTISKRKHTKILKEPVLKLLQNHSQNIEENYLQVSKKHIKSEDMISENLCALVDNCNQLRISVESSNELAVTNKSSTNETTWWKAGTSCPTQNKEVGRSQSQAGTCSQQALNPPCDVTIDELASYFETLVHIPKKMSSMAEMMYI